MVASNRRKVNATLQAYYQHLLASTTFAGPARSVTHCDVLDQVIRNPVAALRSVTAAMSAGKVSPCAAQTIFEHLLYHDAPLP